MKNIIVITLLLSVGIIAQTKKLSLEESIKIGMQNSKDLKIAKSKLISASAEVTAATSQLLPQIGLTASYMRLSNIPPFDISLPFLPSPIQISPVILNNYNIKLSVQQPLFTGFRLWSLKNVAESNNNAEIFEYQKDLNETAFIIQNAFWNFYKAQQYDNVLEENLNQMKQHLDDTRNFMENNLATKNDLLKLEVQYSSINLQKIEADNQLDIARMVFNQTINLPLDQLTEIEVPDLTANKLDYKSNDLINEARINRNELKSMKQRIDASISGIRAAQSAWLPSVYLIGDYYDNRPNQRIQPAVDAFKETWDVGVTLSWSVWNWGYTSSQTTIAEQNKMQAETSLSQLNDAVELEVNRNLITLQRAYDKVNVARLTVEQAQENYRITQEKYNTQVASSTDLIDAESSLLQAKTNFNNTMVDYEIAKIQLDKSIGKKIY